MFRFSALLLFPASLVTCIPLAQAQTAPVATTGAPAAPAAAVAQPAAQSITLADLDGSVIEAVIAEYRIVKSDIGTGPQRAKFVMRVAVGPGDAIKYDQTITIHRIKRGDSDTRTHNGSTKLGIPHKFRDGNAVWVLENNALTLLRTLSEGAAMWRFALKRNDKGMSCEVEKPFARENGVGGLQTTSTNFGARNVKFLSVKQESATCKVKPPRASAKPG